MMIKLVGKTYPHREQIKGMGGVWRNAVKSWFISEQHHAKAQCLIDGVPYIEPEKPKSNAKPPSQKQSASLPKCFATLGFSLGVSNIEAKAAYMRLRAKAHPDKGGSEKMFHEIQKAYQAFKKMRGVK